MWAELILIVVLSVLATRKHRKPRQRQRLFRSMPIATKKYIRKPLVVDAVQVSTENFEELAAWCQGTIQNNDGTNAQGIDPSSQHIHVRVHNPRSARQSKAFVGDWLLYTERGYKIYNTKAFLGTFAPYNPS
jgi:hypothetical protein